MVVVEDFIRVFNEFLFFRKGILKIGVYALKFYKVQGLHILLLYVCSKLNQGNMYEDVFALSLSHTLIYLFILT